ncbi:YecA family protein [Gordonia phthalatica]|uniref:SEC-C motif-containing protein n=1 Tax=Gordonia phthalatica TaxID=1136941 RepID=A0A0N9NIE8_9ACTN|nr:SEC-C metal-binding domain-containing protein [Gordonia phthalatica]ALG85291.1 hypothetical protein ACH46_13425 [Gordonia phthalatica]
MDGEEAFTTAIELLREHGPLSEDEWIDLLVKHEVDEDTATEIVVDGDHPAVLLLDSRLAVVDDLVDRLHFTHRLTADEIASDILLDTIDLYPMTGRVAGLTVSMHTDPDLFAERGLDPAPDQSGIVTERGTLSEYQPGDLVEVTIRFNADPNKAQSHAHLIALEARREMLGLPVADIEVTPADNPAEVDVTDAVEEALAAGRGGIVYFDTVVWHLVVTKGFFTEPTLPLSELLDTAGYIVAHDFVARAGTDVDDILDQQRTAHIREEYQLPSAHAADVALTIGRLVVRTETEQDELIEKRMQADPHYFDVLGDDRAHMPVVEVVVSRINQARDRSDDDGKRAVTGFRRVSTTLLRHVSTTKAKAGALYLAARGAAIDGDLENAERLLHDAARIDRDAFAPRLMLSSLTILRDDFTRAQTLLIEIGAYEGDPVLDTVNEILANTGPEPGRNEPCWCGSGRKYKSCHRGKPPVNEEQRAFLVSLKAAEFLGWSGGLDAVESLHDLRVSFISDPDVFDVLSEDRELAIDIMLIEGGAYARLLDVARDYLTEDDVTYIEGILERGRSVFEIEDVEPGIGMTLRDLRDDQRYQISEERGSSAVQRGTFICTRLAPKGDTFTAVVTPDPVAAHDAPILTQMLVDGIPPVELITMLSSRFIQQSALIDDLAENGAHLASLRLTQPEAVKAWLDDNLEWSVDCWIIEDDMNLRGQVRLEVIDNATTAKIIAFAEDGLESIIDSIVEVDADATVVDERHLTADELADELEAAAEPKGPHLRSVD